MTRIPCNLFAVLFPVALFIMASCIPDEEKITYDSSAKLRFSSDSVVFDTVFTDFGSVTRRLKVYNDSKNAVNISDISLAAGNSSYLVAINGEYGESFEDVRLLGKDSMLVLVEVFIDPQDKDMPYLVTDELMFQTNGNEQQVVLVAYGQDAHYINGEILECNVTWTADRPYLIYNSVLIPAGCSLTIEEGTRVYSHNASYIFIEGSLQVAGSPESPVLFTNDRFEEIFANAPGQWGGIILLENSGPHSLDHMKLRNAQVGIYAGMPDDNDDPDLVISNSVIENIGGSDILPDGDFQIIPGFGILSFNSDIYAYNVLINNCQERVIGNFAGGTYQYDHCTFANFSFAFFRQRPAILWSDNVILGDDSQLQYPLNIVFRNSILWGSLADELQISITGPENESTFFISDNIIRTTDYQDQLIPGNLVNSDPMFSDPEKYLFNLRSGSPAINAGTNIGITTDLPGNPRDGMPDLGAFEYIE